MSWRARGASAGASVAAACGILVIVGVLATIDDLAAFLLQPDFGGYYLAARADARSDSIYSDAVRAQLAEQLPHGAYAGSTFYLYPPIFAAALRPLAALRFSVAAGFWLVLNAALMGLAAFHLLRLYRWSRGAALAGAAGTLLLPGAQQSLLHGQINWLPLGAIVFCLRDWTRSRPGTSGGLLLGVASAFKLFPVFLSAAAPPSRRLRTLLLTAGGGVTVIAAGVVSSGGIQLHEWLWAIAAHAQRPFIDQVSNQGFIAVIGRAAHGYGDAAAMLPASTAGLIGTFASALIAAVTLVAAWYVPRLIPRRIDCGLRVTALIAAALIALPASWDHYHVLLLPGAVVLLLAARRSPVAWTLYLAGALLLVSHRFWRPLFALVPTHAFLALGLLGTLAWWAASMWLLVARRRDDGA